MLDAAAAEVTSNAAEIIYTCPFATYEEFLCKKKKKERNPAKQRLYFQSTNYNLTMFDCFPITVLSQKCSRMKSPWIWIHSGVKLVSTL